MKKLNDFKEHIVLGRTGAPRDPRITRAFLHGWKGKTKFSFILHSCCCLYIFSSSILCGLFCSCVGFIHIYCLCQSIVKWFPLLFFRISSVSLRRFHISCIVFLLFINCLPWFCLFTLSSFPPMGIWPAVLFLFLVIVILISIAWHVIFYIHF